MARPKPRKLNPEEKTILEKSKRKASASRKTTAKEKNVIKKSEEIRRLDELDAALKNVPASYFFDSCGDTLHKVKSLIDAHGIPIPKQGGQAFELRKFFEWFYDYFIHERFLPGDDESLLSINPQKAYQKERAKRERIKRMQDEGQLVPVDIVQEIMYRFTTVVRITSERLGERFGNEIVEEIGDSIEEAREHIAGILILNEQVKKEGDKEADSESED